MNEINHMQMHDATIGWFGRRGPGRSSNMIVKHQALLN
jgi:hypothetical protein